MLTSNSSNQKYNTIKQAINPATLLIGSIGLSRDISINSTFLNSQGQHLDSPNPTPSNSSSSPPSKPQFNPVNHTQRVPQQVKLKYVMITSSSIFSSSWIVIRTNHFRRVWTSPIVQYLPLRLHEIVGRRIHRFLDHVIIHHLQDQHVHHHQVWFIRNIRTDSYNHGL